MSIQVIFCPACRRKLSIPTEMLGSEVQCPLCRSMFVGPPPLDEAGTAGPRLLPEDDAGESVPARTAGAAAVRWPAAGLIGVGLMSLLMNAYGAVRAVTHADEIRRQTLDQMNAVMPGLPPPQYDIAHVFLLASGLFCLISAVQIIGGLAMMRQKGYVLAWIGSVMSLINCGQICCLASIPVGLWAAVVLMLPQVRESFR